MNIVLLILIAISNLTATLPKSHNSDIHDIAYAKCVYKVIFQPDSTDSNRVRSENTLLLISKNFSVYQSMNKIKMDSIVSNHTLNTGSTIYSSALPNSFFWKTIWKHIPQSGITTINRIETKEYYYNEDKNTFKWKILSDKQKIKGYNCQKAAAFYAGRIWEAWHTIELPISDGPYKFSGLPGLIIKINDTKNHYVFQLESISLKNSIPIHYNDSGISHTTRENFRKSLENFNKNYVDLVLARGGSTYGDPETARKRVAENNKRRNNPLELK